VTRDVHALAVSGTGPAENAMACLVRAREDVVFVEAGVDVGEHTLSLRVRRLFLVRGPGRVRPALADELQSHPR
jgi:hypothetical protein